jgi:hypothetical protein
MQKKYHVTLSWNDMENIINGLRGEAMYSRNAVGDEQLAQEYERLAEDLDLLRRTKNKLRSKEGK